MNLIKSICHTLTDTLLKLRIRNRIGSLKEENLILQKKRTIIAVRNPEYYRLWCQEKITKE